ncbi:MAG TPA: hypothetical protein VIL55_02225 [Naasia sp.]|jgi:hypothetical protein
MTLWQEQPQQERQGTSSQPRSRREARDAERRANETGDLSNVHPSGVVDMNSSGNIWDTLSRRAASQLTDAAAEAERRTGRRVSDTEHPSEPLSWIGQGRPQVPSYDGSRRPSAPTYPAAAGRSFTPEDTHTRPSSRIAFAPQELLADEEPDLSASLDHTMTRRQLRAMRETGAVPSVNEEPAAWMPSWRPDPLSQVAPSTAPTQSPAVELAGSAFSAYEDTATVQMSAVDRASMAAEAPVTLLPDEDGLDSAPPTAPVSVISPEVLRAAGMSVPSAAPIWQPQTAPQQIAPKPYAEPDPAPSAFADEPLPGLQGFEALLKQRSSGAQPSVPAPAANAPVREPRVERPLTPPRGHWSQQAQEADEDLPFEGMLSRNVGSAFGNANALIMSSDPQPDLLSAVNSTGEIFITGSLDLPRSLSSMGAPSEGYDSSEIDRLFEASQEKEHQTAEVQPVRAARAVAGHTSTRAMVNPRSRRGGTLPMVLAVTAAFMAIGVLALLIGGYVLRMF